MRGLNSIKAQRLQLLQQLGGLSQAWMMTAKTGQIGKAYRVRFQFNVFGDPGRFFALTGPLGSPGAIVIVRHSER
jgi:hypothetical protein